MKKLSKSTIVLLTLAAVLLVGSAVGSTRAALTYYSEYYGAQVTVSNIGVTLLEKDAYDEKAEAISWRNYIDDGDWDIKEGDLLTNMLAEEEVFTLGKDYTEELSVRNSGAIESYVRVILTKSWEKDEVKDQTLDPGLIELKLEYEEGKYVDVTELNGQNGWYVDKKASTPERTVLYYAKVLQPVKDSDSDSTTLPFVSQLSVNPILQTKVVKNVTTEIIDGKEYQNISYKYEYDGYKFNVEAEVDAVQTHNAADAIKSAWGVDVTVAEDGSISLQ